MGKIGMKLPKISLGTCALIMYLLGERSSPLHCGQNPLLSGRLEPAPSARSGLLITLSRGSAFESPLPLRDLRDNMPSGWSDSSTERFSGWDIIPTPVPYA
jgi:hypothetical protein